MRMKNCVFATAFAAVLGYSLSVHAQDNIVEIMLADHLDEPRGYCLDIAGGRGANAPLDQGLQAHTCYNYTGRILEDQGFDASLIESGEFKLPYFDVCAAVDEVKTQAKLVLEPCADTDQQRFELDSDGHLAMKSQPDLCVTVSSTEKTEGRGGSPIHVMRPLDLQPCATDKAAYQTWVVHPLQ